MNKIFKVIFNHSTNQWTVTSELSKTRGKSSTGVKSNSIATHDHDNKCRFSKLSIISIMINSILFCMPVNVYAVDGTTNAVVTDNQDNNKRNGYNMAIGLNSIATGGRAIAIGNDHGMMQGDIPSDTHKTTVTGDQAIGIGTGVKVNTRQAIGIGNDLDVTGVGAIAIGSDDMGSLSASLSWPRTTAKGDGSIALGAHATSTATGSLAMGAFSGASAENSLAMMWGAKSSGAKSIAIGEKAIASGSGSLALMQGAKTGDVTVTNETKNEFTVNNTADNAIAIGKNALAKKNSAIALGTEAKANEISSIAIGDTTTVDSQNSVVVGNYSTIRDGGSVNSGIFGKNNTIERFTDASGSYGGSGNTYIFGGNNTIRNSSDTAFVGVGNTIEHAQNSFLLGNKNTSTNADRKGLNNSQVIGNSNTVSNTNISTIIGNKNTEQGSDSIFVIGKENTTNRTNSSNILGSKNNATSVANSSVVGNENNITGSNSAAIGNKNIITHANSFVLGSNVTANIGNSVFLGDKSTIRYSENQNKPVKNLNDKNLDGITTTGGSKGTVTKGRLNEGTTKEIVYGGETTSNDKFAGATSIGGVSVGYAGGERRIMNVAAGEISATSTDAVNGSQLYAVALKNYTPYFSVKSTEDGNYKNDGASGTNAMAIGPKISAMGDKSVAIGNDIDIQADNIIALGSGIKVDGEHEYIQSNGRKWKTKSIDAILIGNKAGKLHSKLYDNGELKQGTIDITGVAKDTQVGPYSISMGTNSLAAGDFSMAIGSSAIAQGNRSMAIGNNNLAGNTNDIASTQTKTQVYGEQSIGIGTGILVTAKQSVALGNDLKVFGVGAIGIGGDDSGISGYWPPTVANGNGSVAIGTHSQAIGNNSLALGADARAGITNTTPDTNTKSQLSITSGEYSLAIMAKSKAQKDKSIAIGYSSDSQNERAIAIGNDSTASLDDSVAIGSNSMATTLNTNGNFVYMPDGSTSNQSVQAKPVSGTHSVFSVGTVGKERQIQNVAAGVVSETSTDAINGSQLYFTALNLKNYSDKIGWSVSDSDANNKAEITNKLNDKINVKFISGSANSLSVTLDKTNEKEPTIKIATKTETISRGTDGNYAVNNNGSTNNLITAGDVAKNLNELKNLGLIFDADTGTQTTQALGSTLKIASGISDTGYIGTNLKTKVENGKIIIGMKETPDFNTINLNGKALTDDGNGNLTYNGKTVGSLHYLSVNGGTNQSGNNYDNDGAKANNSVAIGVGVTNETAAKNSVSIGSSITKANDSSILIGANAGALLGDGSDNANVGSQAIGIGVNAAPKGKYAIALGANAQSMQEQGISIGTAAIGEVYKGVAIGNGAWLLKSNAPVSSVVIGADSKINAMNTGEYVFSALGDKANNDKIQARPDNNFLTQDELDKAIASANGDIVKEKSAIKNATNAKPISVFSVGDKGKERQIQNVAAGVVSATSTDAINGSQLYYTALNLKEAGLDFTADINGTPTKLHRNLGDSLAIKSADFSDSGKDYKAKNLKTKINTEEGKQAIEIGISDTPEFKEVTVKDGDESVVISKNTIKGKNQTNDTSGIEFKTDEIALSGSNGTSPKITNLAKGGISNSSTDAINGAQLFSLASVVGVNPNNENLFDTPKFKKINALGTNFVTYNPAEKEDTKNGNTTTGNNEKSIKERVDDLIEALNLGRIYAADDNMITNGSGGGSTLISNLSADEIFSQNKAIKKELGEVLYIKSADSNGFMGGG
ncbi:hypothetical protein QV08_00555 [Gallibacterium salpingitidis]|uniref:ESPR-type extended signal peptide-containing protein n=1 Tax=Gallibacterium salpingitidis TaxID=505341 RepID=UPI00080567CE|nr:ESPR-type extended signal peptide-containing protein [Gallibacterium salpingitidis]OBX09771.1 hypothetical protein QV08_00555 [Gallibacterium salpingitidis]